MAAPSLPKKTKILHINLDESFLCYVTHDAWFTVTHNDDSCIINLCLNVRICAKKFISNDLSCELLITELPSMSIIGTFLMLRPLAEYYWPMMSCVGGLEYSLEAHNLIHDYSCFLVLRSFMIPEPHPYLFSIYSAFYV